MNEKISFFLAFFVFLFVSCATTNTNIPHNGKGVGDTREGISRLQSEQAESAITSERITTGLDRVAEGISDIVRELEEGAGGSSDFDTICNKIRARPISTDGDGGKN